MFDKNQDLSSWPEIEDSRSFSSLVADAPDMGLFQLTVKDAAALIAMDLWFSGEISVEVPEADSYDPKDPELQRALFKHSIDFEKRLTMAIDKGSLKTTKIRRDLNEALDIDQTLISYENLYDWLVEREHEPRDAFQDYFDAEVDLYSHAVDEIYTYRVMLKRGLSSRDISRTKLDSEKPGIDELRRAVKKLTNQNISLFNDTMQLRKKLREIQENDPNKNELPLSTRARRTFLTIIAALCHGIGINLQNRGAAARISELTEEIGAAVTDETIRKIIGQIDDAVESRMK
jgi:hypothetical protein